MATKKIYLVDTENVGSTWKELLPAKANADQILLFFTDNSPYVSYNDLQLILQYPNQFEMIKCNPGKNGLDFQLVSYLGYLLKTASKSNYIIVSNDCGFDAVVKFWQDRGMSVIRSNVYHVLQPDVEVQQQTQSSLASEENSKGKRGRYPFAEKRNSQNSGRIQTNNSTPVAQKSTDSQAKIPLISNLQANGKLSETHPFNKSQKNGKLPEQPAASSKTFKQQNNNQQNPTGNITSGNLTANEGLERIDNTGSKDLTVKERLANNITSGNLTANEGSERIDNTGSKDLTAKERLANNIASENFIAGEGSERIDNTGSKDLTTKERLANNIASENFFAGEGSERIDNTGSKDLTAKERLANNIASENFFAGEGLEQIDNVVSKNLAAGKELINPLDNNGAASTFESEPMQFNNNQLLYPMESASFLPNEYENIPNSMQAINQTDFQPDIPAQINISAACQTDAASFDIPSTAPKKATRRGRPKGSRSQNNRTNKTAETQTVLPEVSSEILEPENIILDFSNLTVSEKAALLRKYLPDDFSEDQESLDIISDIMFGHDTTNHHQLHLAFVKNFGDEKGTLIYKAFRPHLAEFRA